MASKSKDKNTGEEEHRLERSCRSKIAIIRRLMMKLKTAEQRLLCANWIEFFSCCGKSDHRTRDCLLDQMMRQLRQGKLSSPFTTHVYCRTDLNLLLDVETRQRMRRSSTPKAIASKPSKDQRLSPFIWRERVKHLSALEEQYRRDEHRRWLQQFSVPALSREGAAIQDIGVQVELPVPDSLVEDNVLERARRRQEAVVKERRARERQRDLNSGLRNVAERRQLDVQRRAEARRLQERRLHEQQLRVKERRDHERHLINKKKEAQSPRNLSQRNRGNQHQKQAEFDAKRVNGKPSRAGKKSESVPEARNPVPSCARCELREQQSVLRSEDVKKRLLAYEELKRYHSNKAREERERLNKERLEKEKAVLEAKQRRTLAGEVIKEGEREDRENRDQIGEQELKKEDARENSQQRQKAELHRKTLKELENKIIKKEKEERDKEKDKDEEDLLKKFLKYREKKRKQEKAREEPKGTQKNRMQRKSQWQLEIERAMEREEELDREERRQDLQRKSQWQLENEINEKRKQKLFEQKAKARRESQQRQQRQLESDTQMDDFRFDYFNRREKELLQKWIDLQKKYEVPIEQLSSTAESNWKKAEIRAKKNFLKEATEHTKRIGQEIVKITRSQNNLSPEFEAVSPKVKQERLGEGLKEKYFPNRREPPGDRKTRNEISLRQAHEKFLAKAEEMCRETKPKDSYEKVQRRLMKVQENKDQLTQQIRFRCHEIEMQNHFAKQKMLYDQNKGLFAECLQKSQANWLQADVIRGQCLKELRDIEATLQMISSEEEKLEAEALERKKTFRDLNLRLQAGSSYNFPPPSFAETKGGASPQLDTNRSSTEDNDLVSQWRSLCPLNLMYKREPWTTPRSAYGEEEPPQYPDVKLVSFCTKTGKKRYPPKCTRRTIRRQERPLERRFFTRILGLKNRTEYRPRILTANNRILERKLSVAKASALNKHIRKSLQLEANKLIDALMYEKAKAQPSSQPPRYIFQTLAEPLLRGSEEVYPNVLEDIIRADSQLETHLGGLITGQGVCNAEQLVDGVSQEQQLPLVSDVLHDFYDLDLQLNEILQRVDQKYRQWREQQTDFP